MQTPHKAPLTQKKQAPLFSSVLLFLVLPLFSSISSATPLSCENLPLFISSAFNGHLKLVDVIDVSKDGIERENGGKKSPKEILMHQLEYVAPLYLRELQFSMIFVTQEEAEKITRWFQEVGDSIKKGRPDCEALRKVEHLVGDIKSSNLEAVQDIVLNFTEPDLDLDYYYVNRLLDLRIENASERRDILSSMIHQRVLSNFLFDVEKRKALSDLLDELVGTYVRVSKEQEKTKDDLDRHIEHYFKLLAKTLDPHTEYFSTGDLRQFQRRMSNRLVGIGAQLSANGRYPRVERLIKNGALDSIKNQMLTLEGDTRPPFIDVNDLIVGVSSNADEEFMDTSWLPLTDVVHKIVGEEGAPLQLKIRRIEDEATTDFIVQLERQSVSLAASLGKLLNYEVVNWKGKKLGVIDVESFYADMGDGSAVSVAKDFKTALLNLKEEGIDALMVDLRGNGGGSLGEVIKMLRFFIAEGDVVGTRDARDLYSGNIVTLPSQSLYGLKTEPHVLYSGPISVVINSGSASASEIFAAAIQDYGRGIVIGDAQGSFGKGTVQTILQSHPRQKLSFDGAIKTTISYFYRVTGESTQGAGVEVDVEVPLPDYSATSPILVEKSLPHSLVAPSHLPFADFNAAQGKTEETKWFPLGNDYKNSGASPVISELKNQAKQRQSESQFFNDYEQLEKQIGKITANGKLRDYVDYLKWTKELGQRYKEARADSPVDEDETDTAEWDFKEEQPYNAELLDVTLDLAEIVESQQN